MLSSQIIARVQQVNIMSNVCVCVRAIESIRYDVLVEIARSICVPLLYIYCALLI